MSLALESVDQFLNSLAINLSKVQLRAPNYEDNVAPIRFDQFLKSVIPI